MPNKTFWRSSLDIINASKQIIAECKEVGAKPTITQIHEELSASGKIDGDKKGYKRLVSIIGSARKAGLIGWDDIYGTKQARDKT